MIPILLALIAAAQSIVATLAMAYVRIRTFAPGTVASEDTTMTAEPV